MLVDSASTCKKTRKLVGAVFADCYLHLRNENEEAFMQKEGKINEKSKRH